MGYSSTKTALHLHMTNYHSTIAGLCKNNFQIKDKKKSDIMNPSNQISGKYILGKKQINEKFGLF
jgi:hypothetical protein